MNYSQMIAALIGMSEPQRRQAIGQNWQMVFNEGFVNYVQSQVEQIDEYVSGEQRGLSRFLPEMVQNFMVGANKIYKTRIIAVWESMEAVYAQGPPTHAGVTTSTGQTEYDLSGSDSLSCYRCGSQVQANGLCGGCLDQDAFIEQDNIDYDRQLYDQQLDHQDYVQSQDHYSYYETQIDYNNDY